MPGPSVTLSQDNLFFPLPITTSIENILQITNKESAKIAYKIRSTVRNRYCVKPSVGFLHPKEETVVKFLLDPTAMAVDGKEPDEQTQDFFFIDFAFVGKDETLAAPAFWKAPEQRDIARRKLQCMFLSKQAEVPTSLVMRIETPKMQRIPSKIINASEAAVKEDAPPPAAAGTCAPIAKASDEKVPAALVTPQTFQMPVTPAAAVPSKPETAPALQDTPKPLQPSSHDVGATKEPPFLAKFLFFTIPVPLVVILIVISFVLALVEENTWLTQFLSFSVRGSQV